MPTFPVRAAQHRGEEPAVHAWFGSAPDAHVHTHSSNAQHNARVWAGNQAARVCMHACVFVRGKRVLPRRTLMMGARAHQLTRTSTHACTRCRNQSARTTVKERGGPLGEAAARAHGQGCHGRQGVRGVDGHPGGNNPRDCMHVREHRGVHEGVLQLGYQGRRACMRRVRLRLCWRWCCCGRLLLWRGRHFNPCNCGILAQLHVRRLVMFPAVFPCAHVHVQCTPIRCAVASNTVSLFCFPYATTALHPAR